MGRAYEVRKNSMAATAAAKSAINMRASKEIYMAAKSGIPDPNANLALRSVLEKYKGKGINKDVIERAIKKAAGGEQENYISGRYEGFGAGHVSVIVDSLTSNVKRAFDEIRNVFNKKGGHLGTPGSVVFNFTEAGVIIFKGENVDEVTENLILADVDVNEVIQDEDHVVVNVSPTALNAAKEALNGMGVQDFEQCEITMIPNEKVTVTGEDLVKFKEMLERLNELEDVQEVYHNAILED